MPPRPIKMIETLEALEPLLTDNEALSIGTIRGAACNIIPSSPHTPAHAPPGGQQELSSWLHLGISENPKGESIQESAPVFDIACSSCADDSASALPADT